MVSSAQRGTRNKKTGVSANLTQFLVCARLVIISVWSKHPKPKHHFTVLVTLLYNLQSSLQPLQYCSCVFVYDGHESLMQQNLRYPVIPQPFFGGIHRREGTQYITLAELLYMTECSTHSLGYQTLMEKAKVV